MGQIHLPAEVKLFVGLLWGQTLSVEPAKKLLEAQFGAIDKESETWDFTYTDYYQKELGPSVQRKFLSFEKLVPPGELASIKCRTNVMEEDLSTAGKRNVNIDPGYLTLSKLVLATTKDGTYRVYLDRGIYGQSTLYYEKGSYRPWPWTYADYKDARAIQFFNKVRSRVNTSRDPKPRINASGIPGPQ